MTSHCRFPSVHLKPSHPLRWVICSLLSIHYGHQAFAADVVPVSGNAQRFTVKDVPVLNIVAPNPAGVSHNRFVDYNVQSAGLVLNNAVAAGRSKLAGQLPANPQFSGRAAGLILNEVTSRKASHINGPQEVFGRAADYVLANPNGITVNGASFINTPRASFVVGSPELEDGKLKRLTTFNGANPLNVGERGVSNSAGALDLIAPRISTHGTLTARDDLNVLIGQNRLRYADAVIESSGRASARPVDAQLLGAMQAGRINIISTADGAGVKIAAPLTARGNLKVTSAGNLSISGDPEPVRTRISSTNGDVALAAHNDLTLSAVEVQGRAIDASAGRHLRLEAKTRKSQSQQQESWKKKVLFITTETYDKTTTQIDVEHVGTQLKARTDLTLKAGGDLQLSASSASAGRNLHATAGRDLRLSALNDSQTTRETLNHRKGLWRGDYDTSRTTETARASSLSSNAAMSVRSGKNLTVLGSQVQSQGDLTIESGKQVNVGVTRAAQQRTQKNYEGDLLSGAVFGKNDKDNRSEDQSIGSRVSAKGTLRVTSDDVLITGSQVLGQQDAVLISNSGTLTIDGSQSLVHSEKSRSDSKLFGLFKDQTDERKNASNLVRSQVKSQSNLRLQSASDLNVIGADVEAKAGLKLSAAGDINLLAGTSRDTTVTQTTHNGFTSSATETKQAAPGIKGSKQFQAGVGYSQEHNTTTQDSLTHEGSQLKGATVDITAENTVRVKASDVSSTQGDLNIAGHAIELLSEADTTTRVSETDTFGLGHFVTGGMDRAGGGYKVGQEEVITSSASTTVKSSHLSSAGDLNLVADKGQGTLLTEAAQVKADKDLTLSAGSVENRAVSNSTVETEQVKGWTASIGSNIEYKDLTRPVQKLVEGVDQSKFYQPSVLDAIEPPNLGVDLAVNVLNTRAESGGTTAVVSTFEGATVNVQVEGALTDTGTRYTATEGGVSIKADSHTFNAAENSTWQQDKGTDTDVSLRLYTTTGRDLNARVLGVGGSFDLGNTTRTAVPGSIEGKRGISVQLGSDGRYEGSRFDAGRGDLKIQATGSLTFNQARDWQGSGEGTLSGFGWVELGSSPGTSKKANAGFQLDKSDLSVEDSQGRSADLIADGVIEIDAGQDLTLHGAKVGTPNSGDIRLTAGNRFEFLAGVDTHTANGDGIGGGARVSAKATQADTSSSKSGSAGAQFSLADIDEHSVLQRGGTLDSAGTVRIQADHVRLQGVQGQAQAFELAATGGDLVLESAVSNEHRNNRTIAGGLGVSGTRSTDPANNGSGLFARAKGGVDQLSSQTHDNTRLRADRIQLDSRGDTQLLGATVTAREVSGTIDGDLVVQSRQDQVEGLKVLVDAQLTTEKNPAGAVDKLSVAGGPWSGKLKTAGKNLYEKTADKARTLKDKLISKVGGSPATQAGTGAATGSSTLKNLLFQNPAYRDTTPTLLGDFSWFSNNTVAEASGINGGDGVTLHVGGAVDLTGARIASSHGRVALGEAKITGRDIQGRDTRTDFSLNASTSPQQLGTALYAAFNNPRDPQSQRDEHFNLGLLRTGGHDQGQHLISGVDQ